MKKAKIRKTEEQNKIEMSDTYSIKSMIKILTILVVLFGIFYFITTLLVKEKDTNNDNGVSVVDSSKITLNQLFNRNEKEYYVIATKASLYSSSYVDTNYIEFYNNYINKYKQKENAIAFYYVDLDSALNKVYISEELNITEDINELRLNDEVLFKINNGKIEKTYVGRENILDKLSRL